MTANKALKAVAAPLDVSNRRMLRILRAACSRPLALLHGLLPIAQVPINVQRKNDCGSTYGLNVLAHWP
jgi:hypothetical protein